MLMIRLQRVGRTNDPSFRLVVTEKQNGPQSGKFLEVLGSYNARRGKAELKSERIKHWLLHGAQPSDTAKNILISSKLMEGEKVTFANKPPKPNEEMQEETKEEAKEEVSTETEKAAPEEAGESEAKSEEPAEEIKEEKEEETKPEEAPVAEVTPDAPAEETKQEETPASPAEASGEGEAVPAEEKKEEVTAA